MNGIMKLRYRAGEKALFSSTSTADSEPGGSAEQGLEATPCIYPGIQLVR